MTTASTLGRRTLATVIVFTLLLVGHAAGPAHSAANDVFSVEPYSPENTTQRPWFVFSVQPGQTLQDIFTVQNFSDDELRLVLYSSDGITIPGGGGFAPLREDESATGAGTWVTLRTDEITLDAARAPTFRSRSMCQSMPSRATTLRSLSPLTQRDLWGTRTGM